MKHSIDKLIEVVHHYYPRHISYNDADYAQSGEYQRLVEARRHAGAHCDRWLEMLDRLLAKFPDLSNSSVHLVTGSRDACYSGSLFLPAATGEHWRTIEFRVSFLVPYYIIYRLRVVDDIEETERRKALREMPSSTVAVFVHDTMHVLPASVVKPEFREPPPVSPARRRDIYFDFPPDEQSCADEIAREIEATWGYERMPPEIGKVIVPNVATDGRRLGEARLYDCLFSEDWDTR